MSIKFELLLLSLEKDLEIIDKSLDYIYTFIAPDQIKLIVPNSCLSNPLISKLKKKGCIIVDEDTLIPGLTYKTVEKEFIKYGCEQSRVGWYFKQMLILAYSQVTNTYRYYLVWDSDSVPLRRMSFFTIDGKIIYSKQSEFHKPYFNTIKNLLKIDKQTDFSFINEHMMFDSVVGKELLNAICNNDFNVYSYTSNIILSIDKNHLSLSGFSEYETFGTYITKYYPESISFRSITSLRNGANYFSRKFSSFNLFYLSHKYHWVTFESWDIPTRLSLALNRTKSFIFCIRHICCFLSYQKILHNNHKKFEHI